MKNFRKDLSDIVNHPGINKFVKVLGIILAVLLFFSGGMAVGFVKGQFSDRRDGHYMDVMGGRQSPLSSFSDTDVRAPSPHGMVGQVISVNKSQLIVKGQNDTEYVVIMNPQTVVRQFRSQGTTTNIAVGSWITAIGSPDESGRLVASFLRIIPNQK